MIARLQHVGVSRVLVSEIDDVPDVCKAKNMKYETFLCSVCGKNLIGFVCFIPTAEKKTTPEWHQGEERAW